MLDNRRHFTKKDRPQLKIRTTDNNLFLFGNKKFKLQVIRQKDIKMEFIKGGKAKMYFINPFFKLKFNIPYNTNEEEWLINLWGYRSVFDQVKVSIDFSYANSSQILCTNDAAVTRIMRKKNKMTCEIEGEILGEFNIHE